MLVNQRSSTNWRRSKSRPLFLQIIATCYILLICDKNRKNDAQTVKMAFRSDTLFPSRSAIICNAQRVRGAPCVALSTSIYITEVQLDFARKRTGRTDDQSISQPISLICVVYLLMPWFFHRRLVQEKQMHAYAHESQLEVAFPEKQGGIWEWLRKTEMGCYWEE